MNTKAKAALTVILLFGAVHLGLGLLLSSASGQAIDSTIPVNGTSVDADPVRSNFSAIKSRVQTVESKFAVGAINSVPSLSSSSGAMTASGIAYAVPGATDAFLVVGDLVVGGAGGASALAVGGASGKPSAQFGNVFDDLIAVVDEFDVEIWGRATTPALTVTQEASGAVAYLTDEGSTGVFIYQNGETDTIANLASEPVLSAQQLGAGPVLRLETSTTGDNPTSVVKQGRVATTNATETTVVTIPTSTDALTYVSAVITGIVTGGSAGHTGQVVAYEFHALFVNLSGTVTERGTPIEEITIEDTDLAAFGVDIDVDGTSLDVNVTGAANENVTWNATVTYQTHGN